MTPAEIIEALVNSPEALKIIIDSILLDDNMEHYWGLSINGKVKIHYEYFGYENHVPMKFMDKKLIPLHSHVGLRIKRELALELKENLSDVMKDEIDIDRSTISGTSNPSHHDLMSFVLNDFETFGVCSLYKDFVKISFYDPTMLDGKVFTNVLEEVIDDYNRTTDLSKEGNVNLEDLITTLKSHATMWRESESLQILKNEPYSAHLFISF